MIFGYKMMTIMGCAGRLAAAGSEYLSCPSGLRSPRRQLQEWVMHLYAERFEMPEITRQDYEAVAFSRCRDHDVGKAWRLTLSTREIRQRARDTRRRQIKCQDACRIEVQQCIQPRRQITCFPGSTISFCLGDAIRNFCDGYGRQE